MRRLICLASALCAVSLHAALAQPAPRGSCVAQPQSTIVPPLPVPAIDEDAPPETFLRAAERALAAGRTEEARSGMEMAQTRLLDRSVPLGQTHIPSDQTPVKLISQALQALDDGDRLTCLRMIQAAIAAAGR